MLLPRIITAILGIPLILISIKFGGIPFFILVLGIIIFALSEYFFLLKFGKYNCRPIIGYVLGTLLVLSIYLNGTKIASYFENYITSIVIISILFILFMIELISRRPSGSIGKMSMTLFGVFVVCWTLSHLLLIRDIRPNGERYTFYLFILIWLVDTVAYSFGSKFGKHKLLGEISPKKSVEGACCGVIIGVIASIALWKIFSLYEFKTNEIIILGIVIPIVAYVSDLSESLLKRDVGLKDTDRLLPGHGGVLDRFDSFLFTAPFFYYYLIISGK